MSDPVRKRAAFKEVMSWPKMLMDPQFLPGACIAQGGYFFRKPLHLHGPNGEVVIPAYPINFSPADRTRLFANETRIELLIALERQGSKARIRRLRAYLKPSQDLKPPEAPSG